VSVLAAAIALAPDPGPGWLEEFHPFTLFHLVSAAAFIAVMAGLCWAGVHLRERGRGEYALRVAWLLSMLGWQCWALVYFLLPDNYAPAVSFPLHVCDLAPWIAMVALLTQHGLFRAVLFYWGVGLSTQAFLTPVLREGLGEWNYWLFFIGHTQIVGSAIYDLVVLRYRPAWADFGLALFFTFGYAAFISGVNIPNGWNYGYIGDSTPERPTIIDKLGPWPQRVLWLTLLVVALFAIMTAASVRLSRRRPVSPDRPSPA
jgi:hypothetical integral membrane protein (TIGR02206 family)